MTNVDSLGSRPMRQAEHLRGIYVAFAKNAVKHFAQYRGSSYIELLTVTIEPIIYLSVWQQVAAGPAGDGSVGGLGRGGLAAYFVASMLVRLAIQTNSAYAWQARVQAGLLTGMLQRPVHPLHYDLATFIGWKFVLLIAWAPIGTLMILLYRPEFNSSPLSLLCFPLGATMAFLGMTLINLVIGSLAFHVTRIDALELIVALVALVTSGRMAPLDAVPRVVQVISSFLPFRWFISFPIDLLVGGPSPREVLLGFAALSGWLLVLGLGARVAWRRGIAAFSAVGG